jgi:hypothetical protein
MLTWQNVLKCHAEEYCGCGVKAAHILILHALAALAQRMSCGYPLGLRIGVDIDKKMEMDAVSSSETLVSTNHTTHNINLHHCEYHQSYKLVTFYKFYLNNTRVK